MANEHRQQGCLCQKYVDQISKNAWLEEENARLKRENAHLREQLGKVRRTALEKPFGESTPSGKMLVKPSAPEVCPHCGGELVDPPFGGNETRDVVVSYPVKAYVRRHIVRVKYCEHCARPVRTRIGGVLDGCRYSNSVLARAASDYYLNGISIGTVARGLGIGKGTVAKGVIGEFPGIFGSDRYSGYEFVAGQRSYCLEHLKRDAIKVREDNPKSRECAAYADKIVPVLAEVMKLRLAFADDPAAYRRAATSVGRRLYEIVWKQAKHPDVQKHQDVFRDARLRTWQWLIGPEVPAENNRSEREVRPIALARKVSHGSQSEVGAENRGVFMSVLHTLKACGEDPAARLEKALNAFAADKNTDMFDALHGGLDLKIPTLPRGPIRRLPKTITGK